MEVAKPADNKPNTEGANPETAAPAAAGLGTTPRPRAFASLTAPFSSDGPDLAVKHPLQHKWVMWYDCAQKKVGQAAWGEQLRKVVAVDTVRVHRVIAEFSQVPRRSPRSG